MRGAIVLTLQFDAASDAFFQDMRRRYFPPALNLVCAHLTLFHNLPLVEESAILREVAKEAAAATPFPVAVAGLMRLGRGVALRIESDMLMILRARLASAFKAWLSGQDREKFRPHVTIQNKALPHEAAALFDDLAVSFRPLDATAEGFQLWRYAGGPWAPRAAVSFQAPVE